MNNENSQSKQVREAEWVFIWRFLKYDRKNFNVSLIYKFLNVIK